MKRRQTALALSILFLVIFLLYDLWMEYAGRHSTVGFTSDRELAEVIVPVSENPALNFDIKGYFKEDTVWLFMPCRADLSEVVYYAVDDEGNYMERFETDFTQEEGRIGSRRIVAMQSPLPSMNIEIAEGVKSIEEIDSEEFHESFTYGKMTLEVTDADAALNGWSRIYKSIENDEDSPESLKMRGRGNLTWMADKKSYQIKLEKKLDLLGMGKAKKWVLLANAMDYSLLRNEVFLDLAREVGMAYTPGIEPIDLYINGEYRGNFALCTKVEISKTRVAIDEKRDYFYRWGMEGQDYSFPLISSTIKDDVNKIAGLEDTEDMDKVEPAGVIAQRVLSAIEDVDSDEYLSLIDLTSWAKYYWVQEFSKNTDATLRSVYTYWDDSEQRMYMGPVWDLDRTAGAVEPFDKEYDYIWPDGWSVKYEEWMGALFQHEEFVNEVNRLYFTGGVKGAFDTICGDFPDKAGRILQSAKMNQIRWDLFTEESPQYNVQIVNVMGEDSFEAQTGWLEKWITMRRDFIAAEMEAYNGVPQ